jgi:hypothetical protein
MIRKGRLILHRKLDNKNRCICGSKLSHIKCWICEQQFKNKEPSYIDVNMDGRVKFAGVKNLFIDHEKYLIIRK